LWALLYLVYTFRGRRFLRWGRLSIYDLISTHKETMLVPSFAAAVLPPFSANVTELSTAATANIG
jgi:hypothetical protein